MGKALAPSLTWSWLLRVTVSITPTEEDICYFSIPVYFYSNFRNKCLCIQMAPNLDPYGLNEPLAKSFRVKQNVQIWAHRRLAFCWLQGLKFRANGLRWDCVGFWNQGLTVRSGRESGHHSHLTRIRTYLLAWNGIAGKTAWAGELCSLACSAWYPETCIGDVRVQNACVLMEQSLSLWIKLISSDKEGMDKDEAHFALASFSNHLSWKS